MPTVTIQQAFELALQHHRSGRLPEAEALYRQVLAVEPRHANALHLLGVIAHQAGRNDVAVDLIRQAIAIHPNYPEAHLNLGVALYENRQLPEAIAACRQAVALNPNLPKAHNNLGNACKEAGRLDEAITCYRRAIALDPSYTDAHSNLLYTLLFHPSYDSVALADEHRHWHRQFAEPLRKFQQPHANDRDTERRLRIGYVSPDFWHHVTCHFLTPLLEAHDHARFEIFCYASVRRPDAITERLKKSTDVWRDALALRDDALADQIREDKIDILVDLSQHMAQNRLLVFARKPAPVQVAWLGYPGSTGLEAMDYRLTDACMEPEGAAWSESVETAVRLPDSWFCFNPLDEFPVTGGLPALREGYVTFGSLNNFCKVNDAVLRLWSRVLLAVPGSRLLLQCPEGDHRDRLRPLFESHGIAADRVQLIARTATRAEFLDLFQRIDIALDPFPYNGGTTTCEALWMGIPVLTLPGSLIVSRIGLSILSAVGLPELAADSEDGYVGLAASLSGDLPRLAHLRSTLRERMKASPFMDAPRFARNVEKAYRQMWRDWCAPHSAQPS